MKDFVFKKLLPFLNADEKLRLSAAKGRWPIIRTRPGTRAAHQLRPRVVLPGSRERWESYRLHRPAVAALKLGT